MASTFAGLTTSGVEDGGRCIEIDRVAELVWLRCAAGFDPCRQVARIVTTGAAVAERPEQVAQRAIPEKIQRLIRDLELHVLLIVALAGTDTGPALTLRLEIWRRRDVAGLLHPLDDLLNQLLELLPQRFLIAIGWIAKQLLDQIGRQDATAEQ